MQLDADASLAHMEAAMLQARFAREEADQAEANLEDLSRRYDEIQLSLSQAEAELVRARQEVAIGTPGKVPEFTQGE
jgi:multidrug resistance efflux pump